MYSNLHVSIMRQLLVYRQLVEQRACERDEVKAEPLEEHIFTLVCRSRTNVVQGSEQRPKGFLEETEEFFVDVQSHWQLQQPLLPLLDLVPIIVVTEHEVPKLCK